MFSLILSTLLAAAPQSPWVVDRDGRPGTNFTDLPPAVAAAAHGDTILVRDPTNVFATYGRFTVSGKALTIRGEGARQPQCLGATIGAVPQGSTFSLHGLAMGNGVAVDASNVAIVSCSLSISMTNGSHAVMDLCSCGASQIRSGSTLVATRSQFAGPDYRSASGCISYTSSSAIDATNARLLFHDCRVLGGWGVSFMSGGPFGGCILLGFTPSPALQLASTSVRLSGARTLVFAGLPGFEIVADAATQGVVHADVPGVFHPQLVQVPDVLPDLGIGGTMLSNGEITITSPVTVTLDGHLPGAPALFAFATTPPFAIDLAPLTVGEVLLPVSNYLLAATLDSGGMFSMTIPGSLVPWIGTPVFGQAAMLDTAAGRFLMSNLETRLFTN